MRFLRDAWYCAGFSADLAPGKMRVITMLNEALVLFRGKNGLVALEDKCPHRFAPLSRGKLCEAGIACGYHGLQFDESGKCVHNPHGPIPPRAAVRAYPAFERHDALWVWMGEPAHADPNLLPDFGRTEERPGWTRIQGYLHVRGNYQLVADNLLDLSHVPYLHAFLAGQGPPPPGFEARITASQEGNTVTAINEFRHMPMSEFYRMLWERGEPPTTCAMRVNMRWDPPSLLFLDTGADVVDAERESGPSSPQAHWLTPETERTTHYFWVVARNRYVGNPEMSTKLAGGVDSAFRNEDEPMIEAVQSRIGDKELFELRPLLLATDNGAVRARRILEKLMDAESGSSPASTDPVSHA
jgi:phenylpropionate dioxygenase-like ring-hydroxylating dioxygenase large terminal subunit